MKITKKQIVALDKQETTVRELFPEVFKTKLEDNTYFIFETGEIQFNKKDGFGYGFSKYGFNGEVEWLNYSLTGSYRKATKEEVETSLINELIRLGFNQNGVKFKRLDGKGKGSLDLGFKTDFDVEDNILWMGGYKLFNNGKFAEIIQPKQMTKEEIEKELGYEIEIKL